MASGYHLALQPQHPPHCCRPILQPGPTVLPAQPYPFHSPTSSSAIACTSIGLYSLPDPTQRPMQSRKRRLSLPDDSVPSLYPSIPTPSDSSALATAASLSCSNDPLLVHHHHQQQPQPPQRHNYNTRSSRKLDQVHHPIVPSSYDSSSKTDYSEDHPPNAKRQRNQSSVEFVCERQLEPKLRPRPNYPNGNAAITFPIVHPSESRAKYDDDEGHYRELAGERIGNYTIIKLLGQGTFGKVVEAIGTNRRRYAVKIIRAVDKYREASKIEVRILKELQQNDPKNHMGCIHLQEAFDFRNHVCMVFELLSCSLYDFLRDNEFAPFPLSQIKTFGRQLIKSVNFMHRLRLIHTDLKPENILLVNSEFDKQSQTSGIKRILKNTDIRLIDFGSAVFEEEYHSQVVSTRHYRAPEIILGTGWSFPCDMWSIGCILVELYTGDALFQTHDNLEHLALMQKILGPFPSELSRMAGKCGTKYFKSGSVGASSSASAGCSGSRKELDYPNKTTSKSSRKLVRTAKSLEELLRPHPDFYDLVSKMLRYDVNNRLTAAQAIQHRFISETNSEAETCNCHHP